MDYVIAALLAAQQLGRNDAERYEMMTGRRAPWVRKESRDFKR